MHPFFNFREGENIKYWAAQIGKKIHPRPFRQHNPRNSLVWVLDPWMGFWAFQHNTVKEKVRKPWLWFVIKTTLGCFQCSKSRGTFGTLLSKLLNSVTSTLALSEGKCIINSPTNLFRSCSKQKPNHWMRKWKMTSNNLAAFSFCCQKILHSLPIYKWMGRSYPFTLD